MGLKEIRSKGRKLLIQHPKLNPYKVFRPGFFRAITAPIRTLPDFIIIGAGKCGTTSLYNYLIQHPSIFPASWKEIHYFDLYMTGWYRSNFPTIFYKYYIKKIKKQDFVTEEATPYYLYHPLAAERLAKYIPKIKLIVLLRNPIDRAYSHYNHTFRNGDENLSFEDALKNEKNRLQGEKDKILNDENYVSFAQRAYSYIERGMYYDQLKVWMNYFPKEQFLILKTEEFQKDVQKCLNQVYKFLGINKYESTILEKHNVGKYQEMKSTTRTYLNDIFTNPNKELYKFLDKNFEWEQ